MFLSNLREVVTLLSKVLPQVCPAAAASLEGKTGLKVFTEPTQTTVFKHFLFKVLITAQRQTQELWNKSGTQLERSVQVEQLPLKTFILGPIK